MIVGLVELHYLVPAECTNLESILGYLNKYTKGLTMPWQWYLEDMPHIKITWSYDVSLQRVHVYVVDTSQFEGA